MLKDISIDWLGKGKGWLLILIVGIGLIIKNESIFIIDVLKTLGPSKELAHDYLDDFKSYYYSSYSYYENAENPYNNDLSTSEAIKSGYLEEGRKLNPYVYPPISFSIFKNFIRLPYEKSIYVAILLGGISLILSAYLTFRSYWSKELTIPLIFVGLLAYLGPWTMTNIFQGQIFNTLSTLSFWLIVSTSLSRRKIEQLNFDMRQNKSLAISRVEMALIALGVLGLAICIACKPSMLWVVGMVFMAGSYRSGIGVLAIAGSLTLLSLLSQPILWDQYYESSKQMGPLWLNWKRIGLDNLLMYEANQSINGIAARIDLGLITYFPNQLYRYAGPLLRIGMFGLLGIIGLTGGLFCTIWGLQNLGLKKMTHSKFLNNLSRVDLIDRVVYIGITAVLIQPLSWVAYHILIAPVLAIGFLRKTKMRNGYMIVLVVLVSILYKTGRALAKDAVLLSYWLRAISMAAIGTINAYGGIALFILWVVQSAYFIKISFSQTWRVGRSA
jgi:hypothetical protein